MLDNTMMVGWVIPETKHRHEVLKLCAYASERLRRTGFEFHNSSDLSEACYYRWPGQRELIRVAAHRSKHDGEYHGHDRIASRITFPDNRGTGFVDISGGAVDQRIAQAIGFYFMRTRG